MLSLADVDLSSLEAALTRTGLRPCHALTILREFMDTGNITGLDPGIVGHGVIRYLQSHLGGARSRVLEKSVSSDGTTKLLVGFTAGGAVESVLMTGFREGLAAGCVSSPAQDAGVHGHGRADAESGCGSGRDPADR